MLQSLRHGDLLVGFAFRNQLQHLHLARTQTVILPFEILPSIRQMLIATIKAPGNGGLAVRGIDTKATADHLHTFSHAEQPQAFVPFAPRHGGRVKASAIVLDAHNPPFVSVLTIATKPTTAGILGLRVWLKELGRGKVLRLDSRSQLS